MLQNDDISMALFCDFENVALGVRDAQYEKFDIKPVLERLLLKGSIVVKKAYCDWERYKSFKAGMHEANFELIEIPHVRQSGKNSADIRLVVDALDLCYTKSHVDTFVIISGDSDFSPLVSKLRENAKRVIGIGVKQSTSDLLIANCDEFIYYDDLVREREARRGSGRRDARDAQQPKRSSEEERARREEADARRSKGLDMAAETLEALLEDRADDERVWASVLKEALKRRNPGFNESYFGFKTFGALLEEASKRGLLEFGRDEKSGAYVKRRLGTPPAAVAEAGAGLEFVVALPDATSAVPPGPQGFPAVTPTIASAAAPAESLASAETVAAPPVAAPTPEPTRRRRSRVKPKQGEGAAPATKAAEPKAEPTMEPVTAAKVEVTDAPAKKPRASRPRQPKAEKPKPSVGAPPQGGSKTRRR